MPIRLALYVPAFDMVVAAVFEVLLSAQRESSSSRLVVPGWPCWWHRQAFVFLWRHCKSGHNSLVDASRSRSRSRGSAYRTTDPNKVLPGKLDCPSSLKKSGQRKLRWASLQVVGIFA